MRKAYVMMLFAMVVFAHVHGQDADTCHGNESGAFHRALWSYVSKVLPEEYADGRYNVFIVRFYHVDKNKKDISFTLDNIINETDYENLRPDHYFYLGREVFLVEPDDERILKRLKGFEIHEVDPYWQGPYSPLTAIIQRLLPGKSDFILRDHIYGEMYTIRNKCDLQQRYAGDESNIPRKYSVFHYKDNRRAPGDKQ